MLILTRKSQEIIMIGNDIKVIILDIIHSHVKIGIDAPVDIGVHRHEIYQRILAKQASLFDVEQ